MRCNLAGKVEKLAFHQGRTDKADLPEQTIFYATKEGKQLLPQAGICDGARSLMLGHYLAYAREHDGCKFTRLFFYILASSNKIFGRLVRSLHMAERIIRKRAYPRDSEKTRARILSSAIELFSSSSYDMVRSRDIAQKAGVDVALINRYFGSKKELFIAVLDFLSANRAEYSSDNLEQNLCEDFIQRLSGEKGQLTSTAVRIIALSASNPEMASLLGERIEAEIQRLGEKIGGGNKATAAAVIAYNMGAHILLQLLPPHIRSSLPADILLDPMRAIRHRRQG